MPADQTLNGPVAAAPSAQLRSGFLWNAALNMFREVVQFGVMLFLVRRLDPAAYGQFGLVTSIIGFFTVLSFRGYLEHVFQSPPDETPDYQNIFTIGGLLQAALFVCANLTALAMRAYPAYAPAAPLLHAMSVFFLLDWPGELRVRMLERDLNWARLRSLQGIGVLLSSVVAVAMAALGAGPYSLLVPGLLITLPALWDLFGPARWRPTWKCSWSDFQPTFRYGLARLGSGLVLTGRQLAESTLLVNALGFAGAGIYGRAISLAAIACLRFPSYLTLSLYPVLARVEPGTAASRKAGSLVVQAILWPIIPAAALLFALSGPVVRIIYGNKWAAATPLLPWTLVITALTALQQTLTVILLSYRRQRQCFYADCVSSAGILLGLLVMLPRGVEWYLSGVIVTEFIAVALMFRWLAAAGALELSRTLRVVAAPLAATGLLLFLAAPLYRGAASADWSFIVVAGLAAAFTLGYLGALRVAVPGTLAELVAYCPGKGWLQRLMVLPG